MVVPIARPVATPEVRPIVAVAVLLLCQVPPVGNPISAVVPPSHIASVPIIDPGKGLTVMIFVARQPVAVTV